MTELNSMASGAPNGKRQLNVVFHGLWAWESRQDKILAHTPIDHEHKFPAGSFVNNEELKPQKHTLTGVDAGNVNTFDPAQNVMVAGKPFVNANKRHCVVELPLPRDIRSVRRVPVRNEKPFGGNDGQNLVPKEVTMVQILIYDADDVDAVRLEPSAIRVGLNPDGQTANLHLFAQPPGGRHSHPGGAERAYENMALMFGLDITPLENLFVEATVDPGVLGLTASDLLLLGEAPPSAAAAASAPHSSHGPALLGVSGSNCDGLVVDNRLLDGQVGRKPTQ